MSFPNWVFFPMILFFLLMISIQPTSSQPQPKPTLGFKCTLPNTTTLLSIQNLFQIKNLRTLLSANNLPINTTQSQSFPSSEILKIPFPCLCQNNSGISNRRPYYTVVPNDGLYHIAAEVFSGLVTWPQIQQVNRIPNPDKIDVGAKFWVPLPCSCDDVDGESVVHYGLLVASGSTVSGIADRFGTTEKTLLDLNGMSDAKDLKADSILDVPLKVCNSSVRNDSMDYPLLVPNGTYTFTANNCVKCQCNAAKNWILECEPADITLPGKRQICPSTQCVGTSFDLGNTTSDSNCNLSRCEYAGYGNSSIFTTVIQESTCPDTNSKFHRTKRLIITVTLTITAALAGLILALYIWTRRKKRSDVEREGRPRTVLDKDNKSSSKKENILLPLFSLSQIYRATNKFSIKNKLGEGGFGPVYKGMLEGQEVAVKRLSTSSRQGVDEFENEVICIAKLQHRNLVMLLGYCNEEDERILIYEYMPNKSLDTFIFDDIRKSELDWSQRFHIIHGIARGLLYLHQDSRLIVVHRDLKAGNILLDHQMRPKISDFGLARMFKEHDNEANTKRVVGTLGYISPEYAVNGQYSKKSDIFSFGVIVLEIVCGQKNTGFVDEDHQTDNLVCHAWRLYNENKSLDIVDTCLHNSYSVSEVMRSIHVGLLCVQHRPEDRPYAQSVIHMLDSKDSLPSPKKPGFFIHTSKITPDTVLPSVNGLTLSQVYGR